MYLLDTNVALIAVTKPGLLSAEVRSALMSGPSYLSVVSYWEVVLKSMKGKLDVGDTRIWWSRSLQQLKATSIGLKAEHVTALKSLPGNHQDPFDRILLAQASSEGLVLLTTDAEVRKYAGKQLKTIG